MLKGKCPFSHKLLWLISSLSFGCAECSFAKIGLAHLAMIKCILQMCVDGASAYPKKKLQIECEKEALICLISLPKKVWKSLQKCLTSLVRHFGLVSNIVRIPIPKNFGVPITKALAWKIKSCPLFLLWCWLPNLVAVVQMPEHQKVFSSSRINATAFLLTGDPQKFSLVRSQKKNF